MDFKRKADFFESLSNDEKLEILFEDRKNMFRYIKALKEVLKASEIENYEEDVAKFYETFKSN
ncbi:hypothetical protein V8046_000005 [Vibrio parahaemolyticus]|nr:hypothetical protein [Vibrio parahaemolyticus]EIA1624454.1 hypothetical protein [Vibrio parahaemolyticus]EIV8503183.1 hypothetical protein [Vibrio parahaemolyticus]EIV8635775.1 hypothetical protein [Vibrio parahaemolyticus]EIZ1449346.1 hypothetical protein [Vibrio parahaemolyticus]